MTWAQALAQLEEAPPIDQDLRTRYCEIVRGEVVRLTDELRLARRQRKATPAAVEAAASNTKRVLREGLVWFRGTSLSIRVQPEDRPWAEELHTALGEKPATLTLRAMDDNPQADEVDAALAGIRKGMAARFRVGFAPTRRRGDILVHGCVARSIGGFDGTSPIITFGVADRSQVEIIVEHPSEPHQAVAEKRPEGVVTVTVKTVPLECAHDSVEASMVDGKPVARCIACGETLTAASPAPEVPSGFIEVELLDPSFTAVAALRKKLDALSYLPSQRGGPQEESLVIDAAAQRAYVPARIAMSVERLGLVKKVKWALP